MEEIRQKTTPSDAALREQRLGLVLTVLGWVLIGFDCILAVWIWAGLRGGSDFWLVWVMVEGVVGLGFIWWGARRRELGAGWFSESASRR